MMKLPSVAPVTVIEHEADKERVHEAGERKVTSPLPDCVNVTVPVGGGPPETVALHDEVEPMAKEVGMHEITVVVAALVTVRENVPLLTALMESPLYDAVKVTLPAALPVTLTLQVAPERSVHVAGLRATLPVPDVVNVTVPVGDDPVTVVVHVAEEPAETEDREQLKDVDEGALSDITETVLER
jgi:hypothetical protein